jgi:hypothetical protein
MPKGKRKVMKTPPRPAPDPAGIGPAPVHLGDLKGLWGELARELPPGIGSASDRRGFELLVRLTARMQDGALAAAEVAQLRMLLASFGMLPAARKNGLQPRAPDADPYAEFN